MEGRGKRAEGFLKRGTVWLFAGGCSYSQLKLFQTGLIKSNCLIFFHPFLIQILSENVHLQMTSVQVQMLSVIGDSISLAATVLLLPLLSPISLFFYFDSSPFYSFLLVAQFSFVFLTVICKISATSAFTPHTFSTVINLLIQNCCHQWICFS